MKEKLLNYLKSKVLKKCINLMILQLFFGILFYTGGYAQQQWEAETGVLSNGANLQHCNTCSGMCQVGNIGGTNNGTVELTVNMTQAGTYTLTVYYATADPRRLDLTVNDNTPLILNCEPSGGWSAVTKMNVYVSLKQGNNRIKFDNSTGWAPNLDKISISVLNNQVQTIPFGNGNRIEYGLGTGQYDIYFNNVKVVSNAYAVARSTESYLSVNYSVRNYSSSPISDEFGTGTRHTISLSGNGLIPMEQIFYVYNGKNYFFTELLLNEDGISSNYMAPLVSSNVVLPEKGDNRTLFVPFDNDTFIRYDALGMSGNTETTSAEVSAIYDNTSRKGLVLGSVEHSVWKTGIKVKGIGDKLSELVLFDGFTSNGVTRDGRAHGKVRGGTDGVRSSKMFIGCFDDWRDGMEEYAKSNRIAERPYIFNWDKPTPFGWNSWGSIQDKLSLTNAKGVVDFFSNSLKGFRNGNTAFIDLDSYWDNLNDAQLKEFADYCKSKGLTPGIYWAPLVDWGKWDRTVEGSAYNYSEIWTRVNGNYHDLDGCRALDPTHPGTKARISYMIGRFKAAGFEMIKLDFLGHASIEADHFYDPSVTTGMQAYRQGMEYVIDQLEGKMLVYAAISPSLASGRYVHTRRIACDAFSSAEHSWYTLNSVNYGWWQTNIYNYIDADHLVLGNETESVNRTRVASGIITGTIFTGDNYSVTGPWTQRSQLFFQNQELLDIAREGRAFRPVEGNTGSGPNELYVRKTGDTFYLAVFNTTKSNKEIRVDFSRLGINSGNTYYIKNLFDKSIISASQSMVINLAASDAAIYRFDGDLSALPANNFDVSVTDESCVDSKNGSIVVTAVETLNYHAEITGKGTSSSYSFKNKLTIPSLATGNYKLCLTVDGEENFVRCYELVVNSPQPLSVISHIAHDKKLVLDLKGAHFYRIRLNGTDQVVNTGQVSLNLENGMNTLSVSTDKSCQGTFERQFFVGDDKKVYPNPFHKELYVNVEDNASVVADISIYSLNGIKVYHKKHSTEGGVIELMLPDLPSSTYILNIKTADSTRSYKILKE